MENNNEMLAEQAVQIAPEVQSESASDPVAASEGYRASDGTRSGEISELYAQVEMLKSELVTGADRAAASRYRQGKAGGRHVSRGGDLQHRQGAGGGRRGNNFVIPSP